MEVVINIGNICPAFSRPDNLRVDGTARVCNLRHPVPGPHDSLTESKTKCPFYTLFVRSSFAPTGIDDTRRLRVGDLAQIELRCPGCPDQAKFITNVRIPVTACTK